MKIKKSVLTLLISLLITSLFTCNVFAENNGTYYDYSSNDVFYPWSNNNSFSATFDHNMRIVCIVNGSLTHNTQYYYYAVGVDYPIHTGSDNFFANNGVNYIDYNGVRYYYLYRKDYYYNSYGSPSAPVFSRGDLSPVQAMLYYTFGDGSVPPAPPRPDYGDLNISYSTKIAGNGQASMQNKDVLDWSVLSSNGYDLSSGAIELRLVPGSYTASSQSNLMSLIYTDFVIDLANAYYLDSVPLNQMTYEMTWEDIIGHLNNSTPAYSWLSIQATDGQWLKNGWIWQYRIMIDGEYLTDDYLTIYTSTSSGVSNAENIVNNNYNITLQNTINNINYINNDNSQWFYQDIAIPDYDSSNDTSNWLSTLIEVIGNLLNKLLDLIGGAFSAITDGIVNLINGLGVDILGVFTNLFNNIFSFLGNLDFTSSEWLIPHSYSDNLNGFTSSTNGILSVWFDNGMGLFILIPLLVWLFGVIL